MIVIWTFPGSLRVVEVERRQASPPPGMPQEWIEFQVRQGRRVVSRHRRRVEAFDAAVAIRAQEPGA